MGLLMLKGMLQRAGRRLSPDEVMTVWITRDALQRGVYPVTGHVSDRKNGVFITHEAEQKLYFGRGREWHLTRHEAVIRANHMRSNRIETLREEIARLEALIDQAPGPDELPG